MDDFCAEDACGCTELGEHHLRLLPALLAKDGVNVVASKVHVPVIEDLRSALRYCVRNDCPEHGDRQDVVDELQAVINEADECDEAAEREEREAANQHCGGCSLCGAL
jgi:hypothetical protein